MGKFFFTLTAALAEMERGIIGERTKAALAYKRAKGEKTGGDVPFGYQLDSKGYLKENMAEQKAIELIQNLRKKGYSLREICREMEREGYRTKKGKKVWNPKTISIILQKAA